MALTMLHYYFFKDCVETLPTPIQQKFTYDNDLLFDLSTFLDLGMFYKIFNPFKKDKYAIDQKLHSDEWNPFILECIRSIKRKNDYSQLLFVYAMVSHTILHEHLDAFLSVRIHKKMSYDKACNMIDYYYAKGKDGLDLTKISLPTVFPTAFQYRDFMEQLIHNPLIKTFQFFCSKEYFTKATERKRFFYSYCTRSKTKWKMIPYKLYDIFFRFKRKPKASTYLYSSKVNTSLFNLGKKPYLVGDITYSFSLEDILVQAKIELKEKIDSINQYIFFNNEKPLKKDFNIPKTEKI